MNFYKIIFILIVFFKTETLLSDNNIFSVNNIEIERKDKVSNEALANKAVKKGFNQLIKKILLKKDIQKLVDLNFSTIKQLVTFYQISNIQIEDKKGEFVSFSITFDKDKVHNLFYQNGISYSDIFEKELYILPILIKDLELFIFNNNFFYENWNSIYETDLIEFILPLENIEIIQQINRYKNNLINIEVSSLLKEYQKKNLALILIENNEKGKNKVYIKAKIQNKNISKNLNIEKLDQAKKEYKNNIIIETKKELINLIKSENLIDIRTPSFLNVRLNLNKKSNLVELRSRIKNIDLVENIFVQEFTKDFISLRIKYLGKMNKIINQLKNENINLQYINDQWEIKTL